MSHAGDPRSLEIGIPTVDAEHREQLDRMARLQGAILGGGDPETIADDLESLTDYIDAHFTSEQILMREQAYPEYATHLREHDAAIDMLRNLETRVRSGDAAASAEVLSALKGWLVSHIDRADRALAGFLLARGKEMP
ncbi:MAG TPA: bacteriohemerythrin [Candidatus Polarisedimenticolaceae bacterium]